MMPYMYIAVAVLALFVAALLIHTRIDMERKWRNLPSPPQSATNLRAVAND